MNATNDMQADESVMELETLNTKKPNLNTPSSEDNASSRLGITVGGQKILLNLTDVSEVLPVPPIQPVPLTKHWYLGVANVRGNLYSVTDLAQFLNWQRTAKQVSSRIVLLNSVKTTQAALLIDAVIGLRNLDHMQLETERIEAIHDAWAQNDINCFDSSVYQDQEGSLWLSLDVDTLAQDHRFMQPSLS